MKKLIFLLTFAIIHMAGHGQTTFDTAMQQQLSQFGQAKSIDEMILAAAGFERISNAEPQQWLPRYYHALIFCIAAFQTQDPVRKENLIDGAQQSVLSALHIAPNESELHTLQGMVYQASITLDPQKNGQEYSSKADGAFQLAMKLNPSNPRPYYLQAISIMNTPEQYGGGIKNALPLLEKASTLFDSFAPSNSFYPDWGKSECKKLVDSSNSPKEE